MVFVIDQSQKEELDRALKMAADSTEKGALETENTKLKENLSDLPGLKEELQTLRARVAELTKLTGMMRVGMKHEQYLNFKTQHLNVDRVCTFNSQKIEQDENEVVGFYPTVQTFVVSKIYFKSK